jgi:Ca-activated chloride channel family protein
MSYAHPEAFALLLLLPVLAYFHFFRDDRRSTDFRFPTLSNLQGLNRTTRVRLRHLPFVLRSLALIFIVVVLARPQLFDQQIEKTVEGIDIVLCMDTSTSMAAEDLKPNRLEAAKEVAAKFVEGRESDRIGVVPFAAQSFTQCPLTTDYSVLVSLIEKVQMRMVEDGTAIGLAIATSLNRLRDSEAKSKVIILLTDGQNNRGELDPVTAAQAAKALGIRIYTIGVGTRGTAPYPVETVFGKRYQNIPVNIDEEMLQEIADETGGQYFRATNEVMLKAIYDKIDELEKSIVEVQEYKQVAEVFTPWLVAALLCLILEGVLALTGLRKLP